MQVTPSEITRRNVHVLLPRMRGMSKPERLETYQMLRMGPCGVIAAAIEQLAIDMAEYQSRHSG